MISASLSLVLWLLAVAFYGVGDLVTTVVGLRRDGLEERNSIPRAVLGEPPSARRFGLFKVGVLGVFYAGSVLLEWVLVSVLDWPSQFRLLVPAVIAAVGAYAVFHNVRAVRMAP